MKKILLIGIGVMILGLLGVAGFIVSERRGTPAKELGAVACSMETKLCPDGSSVSRTGPTCAFASCPNVPVGNDMVRLTEPVADAVVGSPVAIRGEARGGWYFEGSFPLRLIDGNGEVLGTATARALGEWMTTEFVPFEATVSFAAPDTAMGALVLEKNNPSGLPENADELRVPVRFAPPGR